MRKHFFEGEAMMKAIPHREPQRSVTNMIITRKGL
jgi:hypothetical protein